MDGLRRWCHQNAQLHKIIQNNVYAHEGIIRQALENEQMETVKYTMMEMQISEAEMKYNDNKPTKSVAVMTSSLTEVICRSLYDEWNNSKNVYIFLIY